MRQFMVHSPWRWKMTRWWGPMFSFHPQTGIEIGLERYVPASWGWLHEYRVIQLRWEHVIG